MIDKAYPAVPSSLQLKALPSRDYLCCMDCTEGPQLDSEIDPVKWAQEHTRLRPWHRRFRIERFTNFSVSPEEPPIICGAMTTLSVAVFEDTAGDPDELPRVSVVCKEAPHPGDEHRGPMIFKGQHVGDHIWVAKPHKPTS